MASNLVPVTSDTPITLKIHYMGNTKKLRLPLRDLVASSLEDKLRELLFISPTAICHFERYSDSAASYVVLDRTNQSVYKQLYRAAKAKQKLKLRVIMPGKPRAVTIEDVPETIGEASKPARPTTTPVIVSSSMGRAEEDRSQYPPIPGRFPLVPTVQDPDWGCDVDAQLHATLQNMARNHELLERNIARLGASVAEIGRKNDTSPAPNSEPAHSSADQASESPIPAPSETKSATPTPPQPIPVIQCTPRTFPGMWNFTDRDEAPVIASPAFPSEPESAPASCPGGFQVCCNSCENTIPNVHYHCSACEEGDFDLCQNCVDLGINCYNPEHWLIKRYIKDGNIVNSITERVPVKPKVRLPTVAKEVETATAEIAKVAAPKALAPKPQLSLQLPVRSASTSTSIPTSQSKPKPKPKPTPASTRASLGSLFSPTSQFQIRTCNNCIRELPEAEFLHCTTCLDFDLCQDCLIKNEHGHHPKHAFQPAVEGTQFSATVTRRLASGRGQRHNAICDGCEKFITGVRHKCMTCPDWDYCADCVLNAGFVHPNHRFVPIYEPLVDTNFLATSTQAIHVGIYCDGPHCRIAGRNFRAISGDRYKCAVCDDLDFCANCEASPANTHNKTHPLIKIKTPIRHVSVTTTGEHGSGRVMPIMGDRHAERSAQCMHASSSAMINCLRHRPDSRSETRDQINMNKVQTVVDLKPTETTDSFDKEEVKDEIKEEIKEEAKEEVKEEIKEIKKEVETPAEPIEPAAEDLHAMYLQDTIADGTVMPPNHVFQQTWVLRNTGPVAWPAGCCVRFVSGDYMGHVDPNHPAGIQELVSASESTICYEPLAPGGMFSFTVLLRTPSRLGKAVSYWRLTSKGGIKFGDRLWCDVEVKTKEEPKEEVLKEEKPQEAEPVVKAPEAPAAKAPVAEAPAPSVDSSQMVFPKLEKESPGSSVYHELPPAETEAPADVDRLSDFDWDEELTDDGAYMTDEEYDILDASDEEYLEEQQAKVAKK